MENLFFYFGKIGKKNTMYKDLKPLFAYLYVMCMERDKIFALCVLSQNALFLTPVFGKLCFIDGIPTGRPSHS